MNEWIILALKMALVGWSCVLLLGGVATVRAHKLPSGAETLPAGDESVVAEVGKRRRHAPARGRPTTSADDRFLYRLVRANDAGRDEFGRALTVRPTGSTGSAEGTVEWEVREAARHDASERAGSYRGSAGYDGSFIHLLKAVQAPLLPHVTPPPLTSPNLRISVIGSCRCRRLRPSILVGWTACCS